MAAFGLGPASASFFTTLWVFLLWCVAKLAMVVWMWFQVLQKREKTSPQTCWVLSCSCKLVKSWSPPLQECTAGPHSTCSTGAHSVFLQGCWLGRSGCISATFGWYCRGCWGGLVGWLVCLHTTKPLWGFHVILFKKHWRWEDRGKLVPLVYEMKAISMKEGHFTSKSYSFLNCLAHVYKVWSARKFGLYRGG